MSKIAGGNRLLNPQHILRDIGVGIGDIVADLGCGTAGYFSLQAAELVGDRGRVYAIDIQKAVLQHVESAARREGLVNLTPLWANLEVPRSAQIPDNELDIALVVNVLFQSPQPEAILKEALRMTKKHGKILVIDWAEVNTPFGPGPGDRVTRVHAESMMKDLGAQFEGTITTGRYHYGLLFRK